MFEILKRTKTKDIVLSRKPLEFEGTKVNGWVEEEWVTEKTAVPKWWNEYVHCLIEKRSAAGLVYEKYCKLCDLLISENGCIHNLVINKKQ